MVSETERLTRLINNVLDFSRRGKGRNHYNFRKVDIVHLTGEILKTQNRTKEQIEYMKETLFE